MELSLVAAQPSHTTTWFRQDYALYRYLLKICNMDSVEPKSEIKQLSQHEKLMAVELWKAGVLFRKIMKQCQMSKTTLWQVLKAPVQHWSFGR
jgi:hypothetical protein